MRPLILRSVAIGVGLAVALVLVELLLRLFALAPTNGLATVTEAEFGTVPGMLSPGQDFVDRRDPRLPHHVTTNALGYRGAAIPLAKPAGEYRILFTGDSFVYGDFVDDDETLPAQLERQLSGRGRCKQVRVVNAGLDAATIVDQIPVVQRGLHMSPDLVIVLFTENDVVDLAAVSTWDQLAENRRAKSRFPLSVLYPVLRRTALWNFALQARAASRARGQPVRVDWTAAAGVDTQNLRLRERYGELLAVLRDSLAARRVPLLAVAYPSHHAVLSDTMRGQLDWFARTASARGVPAVSLLPPLVASGLPMDQLYLLPYDGHPAPRGYEVAATFLADRLIATPAARPPRRLACLEDRIDERREHRALGEDEQRPDQSHHHNDR
jgi:GDSL-like lipase/acylhydrolase family protein